MYVCRILIKILLTKFFT